MNKVESLRQTHGSSSRKRASFYNQDPACRLKKPIPSQDSEDTPPDSANLALTIMLSGPHRAWTADDIADKFESGFEEPLFSEAQIIRFDRVRFGLIPYYLYLLYMEGLITIEEKQTPHE